MDLGLKGKKVILTGGSRGIGRAALEIYAAEGADVAFFSRKQAQVDETVRSLLTMGVQLYYAKRTSGAKFPPLMEEDVTASEVAVAVADMVKAVQIELFEVALWNSFGRP